MTTQWEFGLLGWVLAAAVFVGMLVLLEVGRRIGQWRAAKDPDAPRVEVGAMDGAVFALLGLLIAFTFSGAASRYDTRRQLAVEEANAIGTAYLRLDVLPSDAQPALREQFRQYVDARIATYRSFPDFSAVKTEMARAVTLQGEIWAQAVAATRREGSQSDRRLVLPAINAMIDITTTRTVAARTHAPSIVYAMLVVLMLASSLLAGHGAAWPRVSGGAGSMSWASRSPWRLPCTSSSTSSSPASASSVSTPTTSC